MLHSCHPIRLYMEDVSTHQQRHDQSMIKVYRSLLHSIPIQPHVPTVPMMSTDRSFDHRCQQPRSHQCTMRFHTSIRNSHTAAISLQMDRYRIREVVNNLHKLCKPFTVGV